MEEGTLSKVSRQTGTLAQQMFQSHFARLLPEQELCSRKTVDQSNEDRGGTLEAQSRSDLIYYIDGVFHLSRK